MSTITRMVALHFKRSEAGFNLLALIRDHCHSFFKSLQKQDHTANLISPLSLIPGKDYYRKQRPDEHHGLEILALAVGSVSSAER